MHGALSSVSRDQQTLQLNATSDECHLLASVRCYYRGQKGVTAPTTTHHPTLRPRRRRRQEPTRADRTSQTHVRIELNFSTQRVHRTTSSTAAASQKPRDRVAPSAELDATVATFVTSLFLVNMTHAGKRQQLSSRNLQWSRNGCGILHH